MATIKMEVTVPDALLGQDAGVAHYLVRYLLCDALAEFWAVRTPAAGYVEKRYPGGEVYEGEERRKKVVQVHQRAKLAEAIRNEVAGGAIEVTLSQS